MFEKSFNKFGIFLTKFKKFYENIFKNVQKS